jgi:hypothetical protein
MRLSGTLVQVARPSIENSLAQGVVGFDWWVGPLSFPYLEDCYRLTPERKDDQLPVKGLLFSAGELEVLP